MSPRNIRFTHLRDDKNTTCFEESRICVNHVGKNMCFIHFKYLQTKDVGNWECRLMTAVDEKHVEKDAIVITNRNFWERQHFLDSFNITSLIMKKGEEFFNFRAPLNIILIGGILFILITLFSLLSPNFDSLLHRLEK